MGCSQKEKASLVCISISAFNFRDTSIDVHNNIQDKKRGKIIMSLRQDIRNKFRRKKSPTIIIAIVIAAAFVIFSGNIPREEQVEQDNSEAVLGDSDKGRDQYVPGICRDKHGTVLEDKCSVNMLEEAYMSGSWCRVYDVNCEDSGAVCRDGKCIDCNNKCSVAGYELGGEYDPEDSEKDDFFLEDSLCSCKSEITYCKDSAVKVKKSNSIPNTDIDQDCNSYANSQCQYGQADVFESSMCCMWSC